MDIYCSVCGEPWDQDELHYMGEYIGEDDLSYAQARNRFYKNGCEAFGTSHNEVVNVPYASAQSVLQDLLGDDTDGIAAMMDDFEYAGMLEDW